MNPDAIIELAVDLLVSYALNRDIVYGGRTWSANDIRIILETLDLWLLPCNNPDGRNYVMTVDNMWRKNLRDNPNTTCEGVDLNRNLDILWGVTEGQTSCSPCSDVYVGPSAFSEPETRNVKNILDTRRVDCFVDVHSYLELVLYPWDHAPTQTVDPTKRFTGLPSGTCAPIGQAGYQEYMSPQDLLRYQTVGKRVVDAIAAVRGRVYTLEPSIALYPTTGTHSDYAYSRHIADPRLRKTYGFTFETGPWAGNAPDSFHPADPTLIKTDIKSGILALIQQCICAIELIGSRMLKREAEVSALRSVRDDLLGTTGPGREWIALFERVQTPLVGTVLGGQRLADSVASLVERIGSFLQAEESTISDDDVELGTSVIRELMERSESREVRADLQAVATRLREIAGLRSREAIEGLMNRGPYRGYESD
jgi:hypothetical protein